MAIFELYSKRQKRLKGEIPEIFVFNNLPLPLRVQIVQIIEEAIGQDNGVYPSEARKYIENSYKQIHEIICREYGLFYLIEAKTSQRESVLNFFLHTRDIDKAIDIIELSFKYINIVMPKVHSKGSERWHYVEVKLSPILAIEELNERFKEHGVGYQFEPEVNEVIKMDSTYVHSEIVKPTLNLLFNEQFEGACEEYLKAHEHYKNGRNKECIADCLKAFESVLKTICKTKGWDYKETDTSNTLIRIVFENKLVPDYQQSGLSSLRSLLESGIAPIRNRVGGHGQGQKLVVVDEDITRFTLNMTGSTIIYLVELSKKVP